MTTEQLYNFAEENNVEIYDFPLDGHKALSMPLQGGVCAVAMNTLRMSAMDEKEALAHELGHCMTYSFYTPSTPLVTRARCENRAKKWAVRHLIPESKLFLAIRRRMELWEMAELFEVDEEIVVQAVNLYFYNHI